MGTQADPHQSSPAETLSCQSGARGAALSLSVDDRQSWDSMATKGERESQGQWMNEWI